LRAQLEPLAHIKGGWYDIQCAPSFRDGFAWMVARPFDVFIVDADMSMEDPGSVIRSIYSVNNDALIITVSSDDRLSSGTLEAGSDLFIHRQRALTMLKSTIDDLLDSYLGRRKRSAD
jgi:DNA-binding NarL/FixJ family response regulator